MQIRVLSNVTNRLGMIGLSRRRLFLCAAIAIAFAGGGVFTFYYLKYARIVDEKLRSGISESASTIYSAPRMVVSGGDGKIEELASYLRRCGYSESESNSMGWYRTQGDTIEVHPGPDD